MIFIIWFTLLIRHKPCGCFWVIGCNWLWWEVCLERISGKATISLRTVEVFWPSECPELSNNSIKPQQTACVQPSKWLWSGKVFPGLYIWHFHSTCQCEVEHFYSELQPLTMELFFPYIFQKTPQELVHRCFWFFRSRAESGPLQTERRVRDCNEFWRAEDISLEVTLFAQKHFWRKTVIHKELPEQDNCKADLIVNIYCSSKQWDCLIMVQQELKIQEAGSAKSTTSLVLPPVSICAHYPSAEVPN